MTDILALFDFLPNTHKAEHILLLFMLVFCRWLVMTLMIPFLGSALIPSPIRIGLAAALSLVCMPLVLEFNFFPERYHIFLITSLFVKEALIGFILGFFASLIFFCYELFGELVDFSRAASMLRILIPQVRHQSSPMGTLLFQLSLVCFFALGLHRPSIAALYQSFERFPPLRMSPNFTSASTVELTIQLMSTLFELAFKLALPVVFVCFLIDMAFGFMNRIAPQINAYFLSLPAKMMGGLVMLFFLLPLVMREFLGDSTKFLLLFKELLAN